jgi:hypothetical protein
MTVERFRHLAWLHLITERCPVVVSPIASDNTIGPGESINLVVQDGAFHVVPKPKGDA